MPNYDYPRGYGDLKYYHKLHCIKMKAIGKIPVTYPAFVNRLKKMELKDAIEYPRVESQVRHRMYNRTPIQDNIRRIQVLKHENVQIYLPHKQKRMPKYNMKPNRLKNLRFRFISLFKR